MTDTDGTPPESRMPSTTEHPDRHEGGDRGTHEGGDAAMVHGRTIGEPSCAVTG